MAEETVLIKIAVDAAAALQRQTELKTQLDTLKASQAELSKTVGKTSLAYIENEAQIATVNQQLRNNGTVLKQVALNSSEVSGAYAVLNKASGEAAQKAKDMAVAYGANDQRTKDAVKSAKSLSDQLKEVDTSVGQNQRKIGDYGTALNGLKEKFIGLFGVTAIIVGIGAAFKDAFQTIKAFDQQMAQVAAITMATKEQMKQLRDIAIQYGGSTKFTAGEVATLEAELGKLGYTTQQIIDATGGIAMSAAATGESLQKTAEIVGSVTMAFGLSASESQRVADVMSQSFNSTALGLDNFSESIKYVAPVAKQAGISLEETTAMLGVLANNGIKGSMAGTALRQIMGELVGTGGNLQEKLAKLSKEGLNLAGAQDEVGRSAKTSLLILKDNVSVLPTLTTAFEQSAGASEIAAAKMMDTISGKSTFLKSTWDGFILSLEDGNGALSRFLKKVLDVTSQAISGFQRLTMSIEDNNKAEGKSMAITRLKDFEKELSNQKDKSKYIEQEMLAEKNLIKAKEDKIKILKAEIDEGNRLGGAWDDNNAARQEEINGLRKAANNSVAYVNELGNLRRAKEDQTTLDLKNKDILDKNNKAIIQSEKEKTAELDKKLAAEKKAEQERLTKLKENADAAIAVLDYELEMARLKEEERLAGQQLTDEQINANKIQALKDTAANEEAVLLAQLTNEQITQAEFDAQKLLNDQKLKTDLALSDAAFIEAQKQKKLEAAAIDLQNDLAIAQLKNQQTYDLQNQALEAQRIAEVEAAEKKGADVEAVNEKYRLLQQDLDKKKDDARLSLASGFAGNIATIFGKSTKVGKMAASAQIAIDTYKGAIAAYSSLAAVPVVGPALGATAAAAAAVTGYKAIKDVWAVKSGLPGDGGGGGGSVPSVSTPSGATAPSVTGGLVSRSSGQTEQMATTKAVTSAMQSAPTQTVLVTNDLTTAMEQKVQLKTNNSL